MTTQTPTRKDPFVPKDANPASVASLWLVEDFRAAALKKPVYDKGWEATSMLALKRCIKQKARQNPLPMILPLFNKIKDQLEICARDGPTHR